MGEEEVELEEGPDLNAVSLDWSRRSEIPRSIALDFD
jgi:hypothetical protein